MYKISDDDGFLILFDPDTYISFVGDEPSFEEIVKHIKSEMLEHHLLIWGTGWGGNWNVEVRQAPSTPPGFRNIKGTILASRGRLCLSDLLEVRIAASDEARILPDLKHLGNIVLLDPGLYECCVSQVQDPDNCIEEDGVADFVLTLQKAQKPVALWDEIPWSDLVV